MERAGLGSLRPVADATAAHWVVRGVRPFADHVVTSLVPVGFDAYAVLVHAADSADSEPRQGSLPAAQADRLVRVLRRFTSTTDCYFAVWDGFARSAVPPTATVAMPERTMPLLRGPLVEAATVSMAVAPGDQSPSLWWPADRAWCVATDVDLTTTYVGGSQACVDAVVTASGLAAWPVDGGHGIAWV
ncbi:hypothetical protein AB0J82_32280 [Asanoa sp. NPDC049518]|uniref:hypothetical protein n=1 Tax=unclassified Asanoa TaxID=2685164 RepID=UPI0034468DE4